MSGLFNVASRIADVFLRLGSSVGSFLVGYMPAGAGAVATNVQAKLREGVSVKDFGAVGDGVTDDYAAIQAAITATVDSGGILFFPSGKYRVTQSLSLGTGTKSVQGWQMVGVGNGDADFSEGSSIFYDGAVNADAGVIDTGSAQDFAGNSIKDLTIDANNKYGYALVLRAWGGTTHLNKNWTINKCTFRRATRANVFIGDPTWVAGDFTVTPADSDAHKIVFNQCSFWPGASTIYHAVINVSDNAYQTTFRDCNVELTQTSVINFLRQMAANETVIYNLFAGPKYPQTGATVAVLRVQSGSLNAYGIKSEEARVLYRDDSARFNRNVSLYDVEVNDQSNQSGGGAAWVSIVDLHTTGRLTLVNCQFETGAFIRTLSITTPSLLTAVNSTVGVGGNAPFMWQGVTYAGSWADQGAPFQGASYRMIGNGKVQLRGMVKSGTGTIFTLPAGYRAAARVDFPISANFAFGALVTDAGGAVTLNAGTQPYVCLDGVVFDTIPY